MTILADKRLTTDRDVNLNTVTPEFFQTMGVHIIEGRNFDERDVHEPGVEGWRSGDRERSIREAIFKGSQSAGNARL